MENTKTLTQGKKSFTDRVKELCLLNKFVLLSFFTAIGIMVLVMFCYKMVPFGDITILRMDLYHQYGPLFAELFDRLTGDGSLIYSWESGGGSSFLGNFFNYLSSPLSLLIILFGHKNITDAIAFLIILKAALSAASFTYYLKASDEFKKHNAITAGFGLLYAFSGYFVAYYWNVMWIDGMVLLPFIVLGIERIINGKSPKVYVISLALLIFSNYYIAYMACIFSVLYALTYYFGKYDFSEKLYETEVSQNKLLNFKNNFLAAKLPRAAGKFILYSVLSCGAAGIALLPTIYILGQCSATSGTFPSELSTYFNTFDFLANHFAGLEPTIRSSGDDVLPNIFCGVGTVMLSFLYLYIKSISLREKLSRAALLVFLYLSFNLNYLNYIWHGFHFPNDLPYRFSFAYSFILLCVGFKALVKIREITGRDLLNVGIGMSLFIVLLDEIGSKNVKNETIIISLVFVAIYTIVLSLLNNKKFRASAVASLLFCCIFAEVAIADTNNFDIDQPKSSYASDYKQFTALKKKLDSVEKGSFYRMELTDLRTRMDPSWYNYNGVSVFSSMAYERSANLQYNLGMFGNYINSYTYNLQTPVYNAMFGLKYIVNNSIDVVPNPDYYTARYKSGSFTAFDNNYYLPLAYCVNRDILRWKTDLGNPFDVQADFFEKATGVKDVFTKVPITGISYSNILDFGEEYDSGSYSFNKEYGAEPASFTLTLTPTETQNLYIYVKSSEVDQITMRNLDGSLYKTQNVEEEYIFDLGKIDANTEIYVDIPVSDDESGYVDVYAVGLNDAAFKKGYDLLNDNEKLSITKFTDTKVEGKVTATEPCVLYTSINYDDSWTVYIDGNRAAPDKVVRLGGALLGIKLDAGEHDISLKYTPRGLFGGAIISIVSISILIVLLVIIPKRKAKEKPAIALQADVKNEESVPEVINSETPES